MRDFTKALEQEVKRTNKLLETSGRFMESAPKGHLSIRKRVHQISYYWEIDEKRKGRRHNRQINITKDKNMILKLTEKAIQKEVNRRCNRNLKVLEKLQDSYQPLDVAEIAKGLPPKYQNVLLMRKKRLVEERLTAPYSKCPFNEKYHTHETDYGELVRSKSEQILANTLFAYGIPFHYEEEFLYTVGNRGRIYSDFTIFLPDGKILIWEHLGLLNSEKYCYDNVKKLNIYQMNGFSLGDNFIITMDDNKGNFNSGVINEIIKTQILPLFDGVKIDRQKIIAGIRPMQAALHR